jgi:glutamate/tyrosine decarboxylase-like PLP-dependent enzyme
MKSADTDWRGGRVFSLVYHAGEAHEELMLRAYALYASANLLNPMAFKSLRRMEAEVTQMVASLLNGPPSTVGCVTSGGTESILCAVATYREQARRKRPWIRRPVIVAPRTVHPAFDKAAYLYGVELKKVDVDDDQRVIPAEMERAIGRRTIALVVSAPQYPHGSLDPVAEVGEIATRHKLPLHVDACVGGFMLPWLERMGRVAAPWDFRVPAVTSMSADLHKYAYTGKGASMLLWRSMDWMKHQFFVATDFPGGIYVSPTMIGTRPGGPIAAAWTGLQSQGADGYLKLTGAAMEAADRIRAGIQSIAGLTLIGRPDSTIVAWGAVKGGPDVYAIADQLESRGWAVDRTQQPAGIHLTCTANHLAIVDDYLRDVRAAADEVRGNPALAKQPQAVMYGMMAKIPVRGLVKRGVRQVFEAMYAPGAVVPDAGPRNDDAMGRLLEKHGDKVDAVLDGVNKLRARLRPGRKGRP